MKIKAISFDMDGLLFNTEDLYSIVEEEYLNRRSLPVDPDVTRQMMGRPANESIAIMIESYRLSESIDQVLVELDEIFEEILPTRLALMPGALDLLSRVEQAGIPKAITTSSRLSFLKRLLELSKLDFEFDFFLTAENVENGKPNPEIYLTSAARFEVSPAEMAVFEDSENGCRAAVAAGTIAVAVPSAKSKTHNFDGATVVCDSLLDSQIEKLFFS